jgi:ribosomal-protein-alanine N-acetyltransferase
MFSTPTLRTDRLLLVPPLMHEGMDVSYFVDWLNNPKVVKFSEQRHLKHTRHTQYDYLSTFDGDNSFLWEIRRLNISIGTISAYRNKPNRIANIGVMIGSTDYWGRSFASEAWEAVSNWLFSEGVRKLEAGCMASNKPMIKVLEKNEFVYEGRQSQHFLLDGKPEDAVYYGKIKKADIIPIAGRNGGHQGVLGSTG